MEKSPSEFAKALKKAITNIRIDQEKNKELVQQELGMAIGRKLSTIDYWERGHIPSNVEELEKLARELINRKGFADKNSLLFFLTAAGYPDFGKIYQEFFPAFSKGENLQLTDLPHQDWSEAPDHANFFGRRQEIHKIEQWIAVDRCRVVTFLGIGGIGKTMLARKIAQEISKEFDYVIWRSVRDAPPLKTVLDEFIRFLSNQQAENASSDLETGIADIIKYLCKYRCLLILDNVEALMQGGQQAGYYRDGYEVYGRFIQLIGESNHQSCLFLTSREKPKELTLWNGDSRMIRCYTLSGLELTDLRVVLKDASLEGSEKEWAKIIELYGGNPLALRVIAGTIRNLFDGKLERFLAEGGPIFGDIRNVLDEQFQRLTLLEQNIMYWLAVERQAITMESLHNSLTLPVSRGHLLEALDSLIHRSLIERTSLGFTLQNVVMEYMTDRLVVKCVDEINHQGTNILPNIPLAKVTSRDYVRESQLRLIVSPIITMLLATWSIQDIEKILRERLDLLHQLYRQKPNYDAGNLITLLTYLGINLDGYDFSNLAIWEANFVNLSLENTNFSSSAFDRCSFTQLFGNIISITFSPSGEHIVTGTNTGEILMWELKTRQLVFTFRGHVDEVNALCFSENGLELFSGSNDQTIRMWDVKTGYPIRIFTGHRGRVWAIAVNDKKQIMASGGEDKIIRLWDISTGELINESLKEHTAWICSLKFSPDDRLLLSASTDTTIKLWTTNSYTCFKTLQGHRSYIWTAAFSKDGSFIASGGNDGTVRIWRGKDGSPIRTITLPEKQVRCLAISPDGERLATANSDSHFIRIWDVKTGQQIKVLTGHDDILWTVEFSPKGDLLVSGGLDHSLRVWSAQDLGSIFSYKGCGLGVASLAFSHLDSAALLSTHDDGVVRLWDIKTGQSCDIFKKAGQPIWKAIFNPTATMIACSSSDGLVHLLDVGTGRILKSFKENTKPFGMTIFNPDGKTLITGGSMTSIWDINTNALLAVLPADVETYAFAFQPQKRWLILAGEDGPIQCWDMERKERLATLQGHSSVVWSLSFSEKAQLLASASSDHTVCLWDLEQMEQIAVLKGHENQVKSVSFSPNGKLIASGGYDKTIRIWDSQTLDCIHILAGHTDVVWNVEFNCDGQILASGSRDGTIRIWDTTTFECIKVLRPNRPYEKMNITQARGLNDTQKENLLALGAIDDIRR